MKRILLFLMMLAGSYAQSADIFYNQSDKAIVTTKGDKGTRGVINSGKIVKFKTRFPGVGSYYYHYQGMLPSDNSVSLMLDDAIRYQKAVTLDQQKVGFIKVNHGIREILRHVIVFDNDPDCTTKPIAFIAKSEDVNQSKQTGKKLTRLTHAVTDAELENVRLRKAGAGSQASRGEAELKQQRASAATSEHLKDKNPKVETDADRAAADLV